MNDTKLGRKQMTELHSRYIRRHEDWINTNLMKISVDKWKAHTWEKNSPRCQYELGTDRFSRSPAKKDELWWLPRRIMSALTANKAKILDDALSMFSWLSEAIIPFVWYEWVVIWNGSSNLGLSSSKRVWTKTMKMVLKTSPIKRLPGFLMWGEKD